MKWFYALMASMLLTSFALAQPAPPPPPGGGDGGGPPAGDHGQRQGPRGREGRGDRPGGPPDGGGYGDERGGGMGFSSDPRMMKYEMLRGYLDAVDRYARLTRDPANSGIAAVVAAGDILRPRGADAAIDYFTKLLPDVKTPSVQRAIRLQLVDLYKLAGKQDQALDQLKQLITADTSNEPAPPAAPAPPRPAP